VRLQVLSLAPELTVRPRKQKLVGDQAVEGRDVSVELRYPNPRLERDDLGVGRANEDRLHRDDVR
jgi:hypothetical protein